MWYRRGIRKEAAKGLGWGECRMRVSRRRRGGRGRSRARSNGNKPYLIARGVNGGAGGATAKVSGVNCARGGTQPEGAWEAVSRALQGEGRRGRAGMIKGAFERHSAVDVRMQREQARTVRSFT